MAGLIYVAVLIFAIMPVVGITFLIVAIFTQDERKKASYNSIGEKIIIVFSILFGLAVLVGLGVCFSLFNSY